MRQRLKAIDRELSELDHLQTVFGRLLRHVATIAPNDVEVILRGKAWAKRERDRLKALRRPYATFLKRDSLFPDSDQYPLVQPDTPWGDDDKPTYEGDWLTKTGAYVENFDEDGGITAVIVGN